MKNKLIKSVSLVLLVAMGGVFTITSCEKSDPEPMNLPPAESLVIDLSKFPKSTTKSADAIVGNWLYSSLTVLGWNVVLAVNLAIPVAAYGEAFNHTPVYMGDNTWEWSYSVTVDLKTYDVQLVGSRINNETFSMEMTLSQQGGFQDFKWFEGVIRYDHTMADWTLSHSPQEPTEYLDVHFEKDYESGVGHIRYTVTDPENEIYNSYIEYGVDPEFDYDAYYTIVKNELPTYIEWSTITKAGRVMDAVHFQDELWHCWDGQLFDVDCPE